MHTALQSTDLTLELNQVQTSSGQALADLDQLTAAVEHSRESLRTALIEAERAAFLAQYDPEALREFFTKPYVVRPMGADEFELIVPKFIGSLGGWPVRTDDAFLIFRVSRFIHLINPLPAWLADELGYEAAPFHAVLEGNTLIVDRGDPQAVHESLGSRTITRREGNRLFFKPASRFDLIRQIIRQYGFLPYTPQSVPAGVRLEGKVSWLIPKLIATNERRNKLWRDAFEVDAMFTHRHIARQIIFVNPAERPQKVARAGPHALCGIGMDLTNAVAIVISCPFVFSMIDRDMLAWNLIVPCPFIGIDRRVVSSRNERTLNGIDEFRKVAFEAIEHTGNRGCLGHIGFAQGHQVRKTLAHGLLRLRVEQLGDRVVQGHALRGLFKIMPPVDLGQVREGLLQRMKNTFVMDGAGKDVRQDAPIGGIEIGHDDAWANSFGLEFEQDEARCFIIVFGIEFEREEVVTVDIDGEVSVAPHGACPLPVGPHRRWGTHQDPFVIDPDDATGAHDAQISRKTLGAGLSAITQ